MSNRIDFFQSAQSGLALPAASVSILVDGMLCPALEPVEIIRGGWSEFSWARLAYNPAAYPDSGRARAEDIETLFAMGKSVCIRQYFNGVPPGAAAFSFPIFCGQIENFDTKLARDTEKVEVVARDFSANLARSLVYGQRLAEASPGAPGFLAGLDTTFNPDGKANANPEPIKANGKSYTSFCAQASQGKLWSYAEVIDYLLCEYLTANQLQTPSIGQLRALTENQVVRDLDVTGLNLTEALHRCCERIGLSFQFVPRLVPTGPDQAIVFYKAGTGRTVELNCQQTGEQLSISKTNIAVLHSKKNFWPSTNPDFYQVKDVYRKWCLNEAGDYCGAPYNQGDAFDFSKIFGSSDFIRRRRRFWPTLTTDKQGKSLGYFLQVSFDDGLHWWQYLHAFNILLDECGVWLSSDRLDVDTWVAALKGVLTECGSAATGSMLIPGWRR